MTIEQAHELRKVQLDLIFTKSLYMEFYGKITKRAYNIELNNLVIIKTLSFDFWRFILIYFYRFAVILI